MVDEVAYEWRLIRLGRSIQRRCPLRITHADIRIRGLLPSIRRGADLFIFVNFEIDDH